MTREILAKAARSLRIAIGWTQAKTAAALGISSVHLCNLENGHHEFTEAIQRAYVDLWGVDLHVLAWCQLSDTDSLPDGVRLAAERLSDAWAKEIRAKVKRLKEAHP